jgi:hypothetical protein
MKYANTRPYADPGGRAQAAADTAEAVQTGRAHIEKINGPFLFKEGGTPAE